LKYQFNEKYTETSNMNQNSYSADIHNKFHGTILGVAEGDSMGVPLDFTFPGSFQPLNDMIGGGPFNLDPGMWTDDTSLALCLAERITS
jgi:ADP-ribosylglycohydrolase